MVYGILGPIGVPDATPLGIVHLSWCRVTQFIGIGRCVLPNNAYYPGPRNAR